MQPLARNWRVPHAPQGPVPSARASPPVVAGTAIDELLCQSHRGSPHHAACWGCPRRWSSPTWTGAAVGARGVSGRGPRQACAKRAWTAAAAGRAAATERRRRDGGGRGVAVELIACLLCVLSLSPTALAMPVAPMPGGMDGWIHGPRSFSQGPCSSRRVRISRCSSSLDVFVCRAPSRSLSSVRCVCLSPVVPSLSPHVAFCLSLRDAEYVVG